MKKLFLLAAFIGSLFVSAPSWAQCNVENFTDFEGGLTGNVVTSAIMAASTHGYSTGAWAVQEDNNPGHITLATSANQPLNQATGVLCGNSTSYPAGAGSLGVQFTGVGVAGSHSITYNLPSQFQLPQLQAGIWFCSDLPASDTSIPDIMGIESSSSDFAGVNFDGNGLPNGRYFRLETVNGYSSTGLSGQPPIYVPTGNCPAYPALGGDWLHLIVTLGQVNVAPSTLLVFNSQGGIVGQIIVPASFIQNNGHATSTSIGCPANNTSSVTTGLHCFFDSWQIASTAVNLSPNNGPFCKALSAGATDVQNAINACISGGTAFIPLGVPAATWTTQVSGTVTGSVTLQGQTQCTGACLAGSGGTNGSGASTLAFNDSVTTSMATCNSTISTCITMSTAGTQAIKLSGCSATNVCRVTGITAHNTVSALPLNGVVAFNGTHLQVSSRMDHMHVLNDTASSTFVTGNEGQGLIDHILYYGPSAYSFSSFQGDFVTGGYLNWEDPTNLGSQDAYFIEDSNFTLGGSGLTDGQFGCKIVIRHSQITGGNGAGITHGTDSGGFRSCVTAEIYNDSFITAGSSGALWGSRGGVTLFHDNVLTGTSAWTAIQQDYYREGLPTNPGVPSYGLARPGLQFSPSAAISNSNSNTLNPQAFAWIATHAYSVGAFANLGSTCNANFSGNIQATVGGTSGGSLPACLLSGSTETDGGVTWIGIGGQATAPLGTTGTNAGFLNTDNETPCTSGVNCTRFFDTPGHPYRDQPGTIHGQGIYGSYQWNNSGTRQPANYWSTVSPNSVQLNRDFFNATAPSYAPYTYPHPLQGAAVASNPSPSFNPTSISFGSQIVGNTSSAQTITITNVGNANLTWATYSTSQPGNTTFADTHTGTCPLANAGGMAPGASCTVILTGETNNVGVQNGSFNFPSNAPGSPQTVPLSITGVTGPITASPNPVNFGGQTVGTTSGGHVVTITNGSGVTLTMTGNALVTGTNFGIVGGSTCTGTLTNGNTCTITTTFSPLTPTVLSDTLQVSFTGAAGSPLNVSLLGTGLPSTVTSPATQLFAINLASCLPATPPTTVFCMTQDGGMYVSVCGDTSCAAYAPAGVSSLSVNGSPAHKGNVRVTVNASSSTGSN